MKSYLNYVWIFIWTMYFKMLELCMNFYLKAWTMYEFLFEPCILRCLNYVWIFIWRLELCMNFYLKAWTMYFKMLELCMNFYLKAWTMYEFLFEACILRCLNYVWIFIWSMNFFLMYFKIPYDFTIWFCDPSLICIFRAVLKSWF